jgi:acetyl esterase/lipase
MSATSAVPSSPSVCTDSTLTVAGQEVAVRVYGGKPAGQVLPLVVHFHGGFVSGIWTMAAPWPAC